MMTDRKTVTTTHGRYTVAGSMSEKTIRLMLMPYERLISIHDAETGEEITGRENAEEERGDNILIADYEHVTPRGDESPVATVRVAELCGTVPVDDRLYETSVSVGDRPALRSVAESAVYYARQRGIRLVVVANRDVWEVFESGEIDTTGLEVTRRSQPPPPAEEGGDNILVTNFDRHHTLGDEFVAVVRIVERQGYMPTDGGYREAVVVQGDREKLRQAVRRGLDYARRHGLRVCVNNRHVREDVEAGILDAGDLDVVYGGGAVR